MAEDPLPTGKELLPEVTQESLLNKEDKDHSTTTDRKSVV